MKLLSILITLTSEIGPLKGISETDSAADAAKAAKQSGITFSSCELSDIITWTSAW